MTPEELRVHRELQHLRAAGFGKQKRRRQMSKREVEAMRKRNRRARAKLNQVPR